MKTIKILFFFLFMSSFSAFAGTPVYWAYWDNDGDGHASKMRQITAAEITKFIDAGWFVVDHQPTMDCDDNNDLIFHKEKLWVDADGDGYVTGFAVLCFGSVLPAGHIRDADVKGWSDCAPDDPTKWMMVPLYKDNDGDGRINGLSTKFCAGDRPSYPAGWIPNSEVISDGDCDDNDPTVWKIMNLYYDADGDGHLPGDSYSPFCVGLPASYPANYIERASVKSFADCAPNDPSKWRTYCKKTPGGNITVCGGDEPSDCGGPVPPEAEKLAFSVYPNPVTDRLNITPNENWNNRVEIRLVDQFGRVARVVNNPSAVKGQAISVNTSDLKPGIYNLTIKNGELMATKQIGVKL